MFIKKLFLLVVMFFVYQPEILADTKDNDENYYSWSTVTVGVANLDEALTLWVNQLGFDIEAKKDGADHALATLWGIEPGDIARQAIVRNNDSTFGRIHFVEFNEPDPPVRADAAPFDMVPKNLDIYAKDLPARVATLRSAGAHFRTQKHSEVTSPDGTQFREIHMPSHDDINVVLLETIGKQLDWNKKGFAGVAPLIFIVPDSSAEKAFFKSIFKLHKLNDNILRGPEIEKMIGLPRGAALDVSIWGANNRDLGGIEIIEYQGVRGANLYPRAAPKSLGILHISYVVPTANTLLERLAKHEVDVTHYSKLNTLAAQGYVHTFLSPAGLRIYVYETAKE